MWLSVYTPAAANASGCASPGCACRDRIPAYPSDLTDIEWQVLEPEARGMMAELVTVTGRPMVHDLRATLDAINYVTRYGIEWRALPVDSRRTRRFMRSSCAGPGVVCPNGWPGGCVVVCAF
ncbi:transposase [Nonomuraea sp. NPDC050202]|uniref:transposase n=1 Tax=Nonomuraea sp. NPDC050202 TaxID=3155035 RepID=UPI0033D2ACD5